MFIVSASMPRSASRWLLRMEWAMIEAAGHPSSSEFGKKVDIDPIKRFNWLQMVKLSAIGRRMTFIVKTHRRASAVLKFLLYRRYAMATYIYRDPRDVIVSALERGAKMRRKGQPPRYFYVGPYKTFARLKTLRGAVAWVRYQLFPRWQSWVSCPNIYILRYEDLVDDTFCHLKSINQYLGLELADEDIRQIEKRWNPSNPSSEIHSASTPGGGAVRNKGVSGRYKNVLSRRQREFCNAHLEDVLNTMGYVI